jgi:hypothetical protein
MSDWTGAGTTIPVASVVYATVAQLKTWIGIGDSVDDALLADVLATASRQIETDTGRFFYQTAAEVRTYTAKKYLWVLIDDCISLSLVETDADGDRTYETVWAATDYDLLPENAAADGWPYNVIEVAPAGRYTFPARLRKGLRLTGVWGWAAVPEKIQQACLIKAAWLFKRKDSPLGVTGSSDLGMMRVGRWDPDYDRLLETYKLVGFA